MSHDRSSIVGTEGGALFSRQATITSPKLDFLTFADSFFFAH
jgi:hypothetical protein